MAFSVHTFETNPHGNLGFAFHERLEEGREVYFLAKFAEGTNEPAQIAEAVFGAVVDGFKSGRLAQMYDRFEMALKSANSTYQGFQIPLENTPEIVVALFDFNDLYLSQAGKSEAYLVRDRQVSQITESIEQNQDLFTNILSGSIAVNDAVIFTSDRLLRFMTANELSQTMSNPDFDQSVGQLKQQIVEKSEADMVVTIIGVGKPKPSMATGFVSKMVNTSSKIAGSFKNDSKAKLEPAPVDTYEDQQAELPIEPSTTETQNYQSSIETVQDSTYTANNQNTNTTATPAEGTKQKFKIPKIPKFKLPKNFLLLLGAGLLTMLIILGVQSLGGESEEELRLREQLELSKEAINQAKSAVYQGDKETAKTHIEKAQEHIEEVFKSKSELYRKEASVSLAEITKTLQALENAKPVTPLELALLNGTNENVDAVGLDKLGSNLLVYTPKTVIKAVRNIVDQAVPINDNNGGAESIVAANTNPDQKNFIMLTDSPRILEYQEGSITSMQTQDESWENGIDLKTYGARFVYILDPTDNQIWKYTRNSSNYSGKTAYNTGGDLSNAVSFAIDGYIYVLADDGAIQKFDRGSVANFEFRNLPSEPFTGANLRIYTERGMNWLYILDPDRERVLVFEKGASTATYKKQVYYNLEGVRDFVVDGQKISLLTQTKIYEFNL